MIIYEAFFLDNQELKGSLVKDVLNKHVTTAFRPAVTSERLYGKSATFKVVGYGNNNINEGYKVELVSAEDPELNIIFGQVVTPHITLSCSEEGKPVNTAKLAFETKPDEEIFLTAKFGGYNGTVIYAEEG